MSVHTVSVQLDLRHWMDGGTGVTNFSPEDEPLYRRAIEEYGDRALIISDVPMQPSAAGAKSLHHLSARRPPSNWDLSDFWDVFERLQTEAQSDEPRVGGAS